MLWLCRAASFSLCVELEYFNKMYFVSSVLFFIPMHSDMILGGVEITGSQYTTTHLILYMQLFITVLHAPQSRSWGHGASRYLVMVRGGQPWRNWKWFGQADEVTSKELLGKSWGGWSPSLWGTSKNRGAFSWNLGTSWLYFKDRTPPQIWRKFKFHKIIIRLEHTQWHYQCTIQYTRPIIRQQGLQTVPSVFP